MVRYKFEFTGKENEVSFFQELIREIGRIDNPQFYTDTKLLFWAQHFDGKKFATYETGYQKGGTIRFMEGKIRLPADNKLAVYETEEHKAGKKPRGIVTVPSFLVASLERLTEEELNKDGFTSAEDALRNMRSYYPTIKPWSIISYYVFGEYNSKPTKKEIEKVLKH
ncbi:hypothetical protein HY484_01290 [Candidatus Woesearchaeota archaeon]|nr:hypothetical protein [Candidatus Woesearchaeota archaeon]